MKHFDYEADNGKYLYEQIEPESPNEFGEFSDEFSERIQGLYSAMVDMEMNSFALRTGGIVTNVIQRGRNFIKVINVPGEGEASTDTSYEILD